MAANPAGTDFCLQAGVYDLTSAITPRTGDTFTGEFGAVLDGSLIPDPGNVFTGAIIRGWNTGATNVVVRNLVIRDFYHRGIAGFGNSTGWTVDHNEILGMHTGLHAGQSWIVSSNYVHHNRIYGMGGYQGHGTLYVDNEVAFNNVGGTTCCWDEGGAKFAGTTDVTVRDNYFHDNYGTEIWFDFSDGGVIEGNVVENSDAIGQGIEYEIGTSGIIRNNTVTQPPSTTGRAGIFVSSSENVEVYGNTVTHGSTNWLYSALHSFYDASRGYVSANNYFHDNTVRLVKGTHAATLQEYQGTNPDRVTHRFEGNDYDIIDAAGRQWNHLGTWLTMAEWRALGFDLEGIVI
jgi:hypothetical protein